MKLSRILQLLLTLVFMYGCKYDPSSKKTTEKDVIDPEFFELTKELKDVYYRFPSPEEMFMFIDSIGLNFNPSILLPVSQMDNYLTSTDQALNMGIYISDLAYITLFQRYKESLDYLQTIYLLSEKLRISPAFEKSLIDRIDNNITTSDSLKSISEEAFSSIVDYLSNNDKEDLFAVISIGGFIEFMHISLSLTNNFSPDNMTVQKILDQKIVYDNIIKYSKDYEKNENVRKVLNLITPLTEFYGRLKSEKEKTNVTKSSDGSLVFEGKKRYLLTSEEYNELKSIVNDLRTKIVQADI